MITERNKQESDFRLVTMKLSRQEKRQMMVAKIEALSFMQKFGRGRRIMVKKGCLVRRNSGWYANGPVTSIRYYTAAEVAQELDVPVSTVYDWNGNGIIESTSLDGKIVYAAPEVKRMKKEMETWENAPR